MVKRSGRGGRVGGFRKRSNVRRSGGRKFGRGRQSVRQAKQGLPKRQTQQSSLGGLTMTRYVASRRPTTQAMTIKRAGSPNYINITYPGRIVSSGGSQGYAAWYLSCGNDLRRIWASIQNQSVRTNLVTKAEYPYVTGAPTNVTNASFRYVLETATSILNMTNTSGTPQNVELYDIVAKRDVPQVGLDMSGNVLGGVRGGGTLDGDTFFMDPASAWNLGMSNQASSASGYPSSTIDPVGPVNLGATPYQSKLFKDYFKVVRKSNVSLPIGGQHKHCVDLKPNFIVDNDLLSQNSVFKGLSFFTLVVVTGVPVVACPDTSPTGLSNALGDVSTSAANVSVLQQVKYKWTWVEDTRENIYRANFINRENVSSNWQSVQPAMVQISYAQSATNQAASSDGLDQILTYKPSGCTR